MGSIIFFVLVFTFVIILMLIIEYCHNPILENNNSTDPDHNITTFGFFKKKNSEWTYSLQMDELKIYSVNINSLKAVDTFPNGTRVRRLERLRQRIAEHQNEIDVILVQETKLNYSVDDSEITIPGYRVYRRDRNTPGGGLATYVREDIEVLGVTSSPLFEALSLYITVGNATVTVTNAYRPPSMKSASFSALLSIHHAASSFLTNYSVVGGDFNSCLNNDRQFGNLALDKVTMALCMLKPSIMIPTHSERIIDQIYIPFKARIIEHGTEEPLESRHRPVYVSFYVPEDDSSSSDEESSNNQPSRNDPIQVEEVPARIKRKIDEMLNSETQRENYERCKKYVFKHFRYYITVDIAKELLKHIKDEISNLERGEIPEVTERHLDELRLFRDLITEYKQLLSPNDNVGTIAKTVVFGGKSINSAAKAAGAAGKAAGAFTKTGTALVKTKQVLIPAAIMVDTYRIGSAIASGDGKKVFKTTAKVGGEWGGGWAGASAGAALGTAVLPIGGTIIGGIVGGLFGALSGGWATEKVAEAIVD